MRSLQRGRFRPPIRGGVSIFDGAHLTTLQLAHTDRATMLDRYAQARDAGLEVAHEAGCCARQYRRRRGRRCRAPTDRARRTPDSPPTAARPRFTTAAACSRPGMRPRCRAHSGRATEAPPPCLRAPVCGPSGSRGSLSGTVPRDRQTAVSCIQRSLPRSPDGPNARRCVIPGP